MQDIKILHHSNVKHYKRSLFDLSPNYIYKYYVVYNVLQKQVIRHIFKEDQIIYYHKIIDGFNSYDAAVNCFKDIKFNKY